MDTLRDKRLLDDLWTAGKAPWKVWDDDAAAAAAGSENVTALDAPKARDDLAGDRAIPPLVARTIAAPMSRRSGR